MYKVFVNNQPLILTDRPVKNGSGKVILEGEDHFEKAIGFLENSEGKEVQIIVNDLATSWLEFGALFSYMHAAGGVVENRKGELLFIKRLGRWDLPKGKVEKGETIEAAAIREIEEECGINSLVLKRSLLSTFHTYRLQQKHILKETSWFEVTYQGAQTLVPQQEEGITAVCWMSKDGLQPVYDNTYTSIVEVLDASLGRRLG